nr:hypothetical protein CFP56_00744 [Quercus suber]
MKSQFLPFVTDPINKVRPHGLVPQDSAASVDRCRYHRELQVRLSEMWPAQQSRVNRRGAHRVALQRHRNA